MKGVIWSVGLIVLLAAIPPDPVAATAQQAATKPSDQTLTDRIEKRMKGDSILKKFDIDVSVSDGVATLTGTVATEDQRSRASYDATISGITRVDNQIVIDPAAAKRSTASRLEDKTRDAIGKTKNAASKVADKAKEGAEKVGEESREGAGTVAEKTKEGAGTVAEKTKEGAGTVAEKTKEGAGTVVEKTKEGVSKSGEVITDGWIKGRVHTGFIGEGLLKGSDISVDTSNHVVTLTGTVTTAAARTRAVDIAKKVEGVHQVVDRLTIVPKPKE
jgi:osmotically-inducible protein OsmY